MKILFLGDVGEGKTSLMRMQTLKRLGHQVAAFNTATPWSKASWLQRQIQRRALRGGVITFLNEESLRMAHEFKPNLIWAEKQEYLSVETIYAYQKLGAKILHFTPDPYFTLDWKRTRLMDAAMAQFDAHVYCKVYETEQFKSLGKPYVYMPLGYSDEIHRPLPSSDPKWNCGLGFLGGWEARRESLCGQIASAGLPLKIWGKYWDHIRDGKWTLRRKLILDQMAGGEPYKIRKNERLAGCLQGDEVLGDDYARALTGSKIGLGFLRKVCPDQHTTRTFEIPACGSLLLADRTEEHQLFFEEGKEADFFSSPEELVDKAKYYVANEAVRVKVAAAGLNRCRKSGYSYLCRMDKALRDVCAQLGLPASLN